MQHEFEFVKIADLAAYERNTRTHSQEQIEQLKKSITEFGFTNPVLIDEENTIVAGHGRVLAARALGMTEVPVMRLRGLTESQCNALRIADNQLALNAGWDEDLLKQELESLLKQSCDLEILGFSADELDTWLADIEGAGEDEPYTAKVEAPIYEPQMEEPPSISALCNKKKYKELCEEIDGANIPDKTKEFLTFAAARHLRFDYKLIAEYYAHADKQTQDLMEKSALVIIDFDKAIEYGFVKMTKRLNEIMEAQNEQR